MAFDFPSTPSNGASYTANGITYTFDGTVWKRETGAVKGQKGELGVATKGEKGEVGAQGASGTGVVKKVRTATLGSYSLPSGHAPWTDAITIGSFTPNSTNSVFLVTITLGNFLRVYGSGAATGQMRIRDATDDSNIDGVETLKNTADDSGAHTFSLIDTKGGTTARNYAVQLNSGNNNGRPRVDNVRIMVIELDTTV